MSTASAAAPLARILGDLAREGSLYERLPERAVRCHACGHRCFIPEGRPGICKVRTNDGGMLKVPWGYVGALQCDPIEKKPFFHALPGALALSFGMLGCDYHCGYCQNWITSQAIRDPRAVAAPQRVTPEELADRAVRLGAPVIASTYNEPLITSEWAVEVFRAARDRGLVGAYISNGNGTDEVLEFIRPWVSLYKIDLKSFRDRTYRSLGGTLNNVLETIAAVHRKGFWVEIVTLLVPGFNDSPGEVRDIARFIRAVSADIPWHVTAFHRDYRMTDPDDTPARSLEAAAAIGMEEGLRFVYAGNRPGRVGRLEDTRCPSCAATLIARNGYRIERYRLTPAGSCPDCSTAIAGYWAGGVRHRASESPATGAASTLAGETAAGRPGGGPPGAR